MSVVVVSDSDVESEHKPAGAQVRSSAWLESARVERECEYRLVLDCLSAQRCTDEWVCEQSARVRASGGTVVLSTRRGEREAHELRVARARGYSADDDAQSWRVRLAHDERLVRASANDGWFSDLLRYAFARSAPVPRKATVLWGAPGVGKTLALKRLAAMRPDGALQATYFSCNDFDELACDARSSKGAQAARGGGGGGGASPLWRDVIERLECAAQRFGTRSVLLVDDVDVLPAGAAHSLRSKLFEFVAQKLRCRCVLVSNDWYARDNWSLRAGKLKAHFTPLRVHGAQRGALRAHLQQHYALLRAPAASELLEQVLDEANGDVRAALMSAEIEQRLADDGGRVLACGAMVPRDALHAHLQRHFALLRNGGECAQASAALEQLAGAPKGAVPDALVALDATLWRQCAGAAAAASTSCSAMGARDVRSQQALHYSLLRCARDNAPRVAVEALHGDDAADDVGQVIFANAPRIVGTHNELLALDALAEAADCHSLAALYNEQRYESGFAGGDAQDVDKQLHFALNCALPLAVAAETAGVRSTLHERLPLEFPESKIARAQREKAPALARLGQHVRLSAQLGARRAIDARGMGECAPPSRRAPRVSVRPDDALLRAEVHQHVFGNESGAELAQALRQRGSTSDALRGALRRAAALGCDADDFAFLCQMAYGAHSKALPAATTLQQHWRRAANAPSVQPMLGEVSSVSVSARALAQAAGAPQTSASAESGAKRRRLDRAALKESSDGRVRTIGDMFARMKRAALQQSASAAE